MGSLRAYLVRTVYFFFGSLNFHVQLNFALCGIIKVISLVCKNHYTNYCLTVGITTLLHIECQLYFAPVQLQNFIGLLSEAHETDRRQFLTANCNPN